MQRPPDEPLRTALPRLSPPRPRISWRKPSLPLPEPLLNWERESPDREGLSKAVPVRPEEFLWMEDRPWLLPLAASNARLWPEDPSKRVDRPGLEGAEGLKIRAPLLSDIPPDRFSVGLNVVEGRLKDPLREPLELLVSGPLFVKDSLPRLFSVLTAPVRPVGVPRFCTTPAEPLDPPLSRLRCTIDAAPLCASGDSKPLRSRTDRRSSKIFPRVRLR